MYPMSGVASPGVPGEPGQRRLLLRHDAQQEACRYRVFIQTPEQSRATLLKGYLWLGQKYARGLWLGFRVFQLQVK